MLQFMKFRLLSIDNLSESDLEPAFIDLKSELLSTDYYKLKDKYNKLHDRLGKLLTRICDRHERYMIEAEANILREDYLFYSFKNHTWMDHAKSIRNDIDFSKKSDQCLFFLAWFAYVGGVVKDVGYVGRDEERAYEIVKYLTDKRKYFPALFLRGFMYKYGIKYDEKPKLQDARLFLTRAAENGIGGAIIELRQFDLHEQA